MATTGSSPLARGLRAITVEPPRRPGIIPARAGFTSSASSTPSAGPDHPRSRGVYPTVWVGGQCGAGSSPLARGLHEWEAERPDANRIIPARAGFTAVSAAPGRQPEDHPRSRGVYNISDDDPAGEGGSSPLARGLPKPQPRRPRYCQDHPRSRGVYCGGQRHLLAGDGSSPLARGLRASRRPSRRLGGIIPARAGFTGWAPRTGAGGSDHPRSRGVYATCMATAMASRGSSPLARGLRGHDTGRPQPQGIIPARAGFTISP